MIEHEREEIEHLENEHSKLSREVVALQREVETHKARAKARERERDAANERAERLNAALRDATSREHTKHLQLTAAEQRVREAEEHEYAAHRAHELTRAEWKRDKVRADHLAEALQGYLRHAEHCDRCSDCQASGDLDDDARAALSTSPAKTPDTEGDLATDDVPEPEQDNAGIKPLDAKDISHPTPHEPTAAERTLDHLRGPRVGQWVLLPGVECEGEWGPGEEWWTHPFFDSEMEAVEEAKRSHVPCWVAEAVSVPGGWSTGTKCGPWGDARTGPTPEPEHTDKMTAARMEYLDRDDDADPTTPTGGREGGDNGC